MNINLYDIKHTRPHFPVLIREILNNISLINTNNQHKIYLDCTFGAGGYSEFILQNFPNISIVAIDRDSIVFPHVNTLREKYPNRFNFFLDKFENFDKILIDNGINMVDGIIMDLGFSTLQINDNNRGFSFMRDSKISMEMGLNNISAYDFINTASFDLLSDVIFHYGQEHKAKQISRAIINKRLQKSIDTTKELADIIAKVVGYKQKIHPATKTFQAIRIYINDELNQLKNVLNKSLKYLNHNGQIIIVSFHSLEDSLVKDFFNSNGDIDKYYNKINNKMLQSDKVLRIINKKPITAQEDELFINPPSSSAKLRIATKI